MEGTLYFVQPKILPDPIKRALLQKVTWNAVNSNKVSANILLDENVGYCKVKGHTVLLITTEVFWMDLHRMISIQIH